MNSQSGPTAESIHNRYPPMPILDRTLLGIAPLKSDVLVSIIRRRHVVSIMQSNFSIRILYERKKDKLRDLDVFTMKSA